MLRVNLTLAIRELSRTIEVGGFLRLIQEVENSFSCGKGAEDFVDDVRNLVDGAGKLTAVKDKAGNLFEAHDGLHVEYGAAHADGGEAEVGDHADGGTHLHAHAVRIPVSLRGIAVDLAEFFGHLVLAGVGKDRLLTRKHLFCVAVHDAVSRASLGIQGARDLSHTLGVPDGERDRKDHAEHQRNGDGAHDDKASDHGDRACEDLDHVRGKAGGHHVDVVGDAADDVAGLIPVEVADGKLHELFKHVLTKVLRHALADAGHADADGKAQNV